MGLLVLGREVRELRWEWPREEAEESLMEQGTSGRRE